MKEDIKNTSDSSKETRNVFIGAKVTPTQNVHKATYGNVQSDSVYGGLAERIRQCSRKCLPVPECSKREE